ncbi:MAG: Uma2 family endonuclease [Chloroflexi bacterium]|nr:Uma2 family endonuclease [Chloroflexota bacterium]
MTADEFDRFALADENSERILEFIDGEVFEVPSNPYASKISMRVGVLIGVYLLRQPIGHLTGEAGGYRVSGDRYAPDVAFVRRDKQEEVATEGYNPVPPDLAVEVEYPTSIKSQRRLEKKLARYAADGTTVWVVYPETREVEVHTPNQPVRIVGIDGALDGGDILPGFTLAVRDIFPDSDAPDVPTSGA